MSTTLTGGAAAWPLDPGYDATQTAAAGGGRGGYTYSGTALDPTVVGPGDKTWLEDSRRERGGLGGRPVPNDPKDPPVSGRRRRLRRRLHGPKAARAVAVVA